MGLRAAQYLFIYKRVLEKYGRKSIGIYSTVHRKNQPWKRSIFNPVRVRDPEVSFISQATPEAGSFDDDDACSNAMGVSTPLIFNDVRAFFLLERLYC